MKLGCFVFLHSDIHFETEIGNKEFPRIPQSAENKAPEIFRNQ